MSDTENAVLSDLLLECGASRVAPWMLRDLREVMLHCDSEHAIRLAAESLLDFVIASVEFGVSDGSCELVAVDGRKISIRLDGDCCSFSTFEAHSVEEMKGLVGQRLRDVEHVQSSLTPERLVQHDHSIYRAIKFSTDDGVVVADWRNDSNGYYDGTCTITGCWASDSYGVEGR